MADPMTILVYSITLSGVYALLAFGFTLIYGVANVTNLAHGGFYMFGAYIFAAFVTVFFQLDIAMAFILTAVITTILGAIVYKLVIHPVIEDQIAVMVVTIAVTLVLQQIAIIIFGPEPVYLPPLLKGTSKIFGVQITNERLLSFATSLILFGGLSLITIKSKIGKAMKAVAQDSEAAMLMGINVERIYMIAMIISAFSAAVAGILIGSTRGLATPRMWESPLFMSFAIVIVGGLGSIKGTIIGALIIGFAETFIIFLTPQGTHLAGAVALAVMVLVLLFRPKGMFGKHIELE